MFGLRNEKDFINTLNDVIRKRGAMDKLVSDRAQVGISDKVQNVLRHLCISDWQSEPHYQHQNAAERRYQNVKRNTNSILNTTGAPGESWYLCLGYVCFIMNRMAVRSLHWRTPLEMLNGITPDISMIYCFCFWDEIYFRREDTCGKNFPSLSNEEKGRFFGFSEHVGHGMTYKVLTDDTSKVIFRSRIRLANVLRNRRLDGPTKRNIVSTRGGRIHGNSMEVIDPDDLIGRNYLSPPDNYGNRERIRILETIDEQDNRIMGDPQMIRFKCSTDDGQYQEVKTYNDLLDKVEALDDEEGESRFKSIDDHHGPLKGGP